MADRWYSLVQLAEILPVKVNTIRKWCHLGRFPNARRDGNGKWIIPACDVKAYSTTLDKAQDEVGDLEQQIRLVELKIRLAELEHKRDLPEILKQKEDEAIEKEDDLDRREAVIVRAEKKQREARNYLDYCLDQQNEWRKEIRHFQEMIIGDLLKLREYYQKLVKAGKDLYIPEPDLSDFELSDAVYKEEVGLIIPPDKSETEPLDKDMFEEDNEDDTIED